MKISNEFHPLILKEFKNVQKLVKEANTVDDKLYFFSASYGVLNRVMNFNCDKTLVFMHQILQATHQSLVQRLASPKIPGSISNNLPNEMIDALFTYFEQLIIEFEKKDSQNIREILEKFANLTYATTGNGYYLYLKGNLVIK